MAEELKTTGPQRRMPKASIIRHVPLDQPADYYLSVPFQDWDEERMFREIEAFIEETGLEDYSDYIRRGALLNYDRNVFSHERSDRLKLKPIEQQYLQLEYSPRRIDKFRQASGLWILVALCSIGAAGKLECPARGRLWLSNVNHRLVQGWDESAVNGG